MKKRLVESIALRKGSFNKYENTKSIVLGGTSPAAFQIKYNITHVGQHFVLIFLFTLMVVTTDN